MPCIRIIPARRAAIHSRATPHPADCEKASDVSGRGGRDCEDKLRRCAHVIVGYQRLAARSALLRRANLSPCGLMSVRGSEESVQNYGYDKGYGF